MKKIIFLLFSLFTLNAADIAIVLPPDAVPAEKTAAAELRKYLSRLAKQPVSIISSGNCGTILFKHLHISRQGILIRFPLFSHWEHHTFQRIFCVWISGKSGGRSSSLNCPMQQTVQRKEFQLSVFSGRKIQNG